MASERQFEMIFALNARMNGGFSGTFSKAQAEFTRLGKEIQSLHKVQGDIASYQKQQSAIESTRAKLESLQKQHDLLQKEISETTGATTGLEREKVKLEERIKNTEAALERQSQKLDTTGAKLKAAGVDTGNLAQKDAELTAKIKELETEQGKAADSASSFGEKSAQAFGAVQSAIASAGIAVALKEIAGAYMECVGVAGGFEEAMSNVEALSQSNEQEMAALTEQAKELGATTKFTAQEAGDAMGYMAMAGWDASEMIAGMNGVLQLAAASGEDLAMVSDIVTDSLTAFGLEASDTARFSDVLAAAATRSNTNVRMLGESFKYVAPVAGSLGFSVEDTAVALGIMANSGIKATQAGTSLRSLFTNLVRPVGQAAEAIEALDLNIVNMDGSTKPLNEILQELRDTFSGLTSAQQAQYGAMLAGQEGMSGLLALVNATDADYASLTDSINNCTGSAQRMANVKLDNLNGQLTLMDSAWEALQTTIGEQFNPELRGLSELATDALGWVNGFIKANPALVRGIMAAAGAVGAGVVALTGVATVTKVLIPLMTALTAATPGVNIIMGVTAAVAAVVGVVAALTTAVDDSVPSVKELTEAAQGMREAMDEANATYDDTVSQTMAAASVADTYIAKLEEMEAAGVKTDEEHRQYHNTLALLCQVVPELADYIDLETDTIEGGTAALRANTEAWKRNAMQQAYQEQLTALYSQYSAVLVEAEENSIGLTKAQLQLEAAQKKQTDTYSRMNELEAEAYAKAQEQSKEYGTLVDYTTLLTQEYWDLQNSLTDVNDEIYTAEQSIKNHEKAIEEDKDAVAEAEEEIALAEEAVRNLTDATREGEGAAGEAAAGAQELQSAIDSTAEEVMKLSEAYSEAYTAALDSISGQYALWDEAAEVVATSAGSINSALESQISYWQNYNANLQSLTERSADIEGLSAVIASFADGSQDSVNAIAGLASASDEDLRAMVENWQELQREQEEAAGSVADLKTDFTSTMDELQADLVEDIEAMDLGDEAAESGKATIQGYISGANSMLPAVRRAYEALGRAASDALGPAPAAGGNVPMYASGTDNAAPGLALVGEEGPELVYFGGGEKVLDAAQTAAIRANAPTSVTAMLSASGGSSPSVQVVFQIGGNATPETVQALQEYGDEFAARVLEVLEDAGVDAQRRAY